MALEAGRYFPHFLPGDAMQSYNEGAYAMAFPPGELRPVFMEPRQQAPHAATKPVYRKGRNSKASIPVQAGLLQPGQASGRQGPNGRDDESTAASSEASQDLHFDTPGSADEPLEARAGGPAPAGPIKAKKASAAAPALDLLGSAALPTVGSSEHAAGRCKPCAFVFKDGCASGVNCKFCHLCAPGEKKRRKKVRRELRRARGPCATARTHAVLAATGAVRTWT